MKVTLDWMAVLLATGLMLAIKIGLIARVPW